jgi:hypothetical protein
LGLVITLNQYKQKNMKENNFFQRIHDGSKFGKYALYTLLSVIVACSMAIGYICWAISRPIVALAHLFLLHPHTALDEIKDFHPSYSLKDLRVLK